MSPSRPPSSRSEPQAGERAHKRVDQGLRTRARLIEEAARLFARDGYAGVSTQAVLDATGVTRGALYHHFDDKQALFEAVFTETCATIERRIMEGAAGTSYVGGLISGCLVFLRECVDPSITRIYLVDGLAVLGWKLWWEIDSRHTLAALEHGVDAACEEAGIDDPALRKGLFTLISGALNAAALRAANAADPAAEVRELEPAVERLIRGALIRNGLGQG
ncbi:TetR/AcrR family transcriptional regulator [Phenylobacterium sp.]|uniref:TetR/AcrR family transcriptional regulator n=1 Tax=Phenylobacterium sp. TaxID=1871053 RepID=UPI0039197AC0